MDGFGTDFAVKTATLQKTRLLLRLQPDIALARKLADSPVLRRWAAAEEDPFLRELALAELYSFRRLFSDGSFFFAMI